MHTYIQHLCLFVCVHLTATSPPTNDAVTLRPRVFIVQYNRKRAKCLTGEAKFRHITPKLCCWYLGWCFFLSFLCVRMWRTSTEHRTDIETRPKVGAELMRFACRQVSFELPKTEWSEMKKNVNHDATRDTCGECRSWNICSVDLEGSEGGFNTPLSKQVLYNTFNRNPKCSKRIASKNETCSSYWEFNA